MHVGLVTKFCLGLVCVSTLGIRAQAQPRSSTSGAERVVSVLEIIHDTAVIPPRALEAMELDPLSVFGGVAQEERMNVGLRVTLELNAPGAGSVTDIQWTVPGSVIKGYSIASAVEFDQGYLTECATTDLRAADLHKQRDIAYYYTGTGTSEVVLTAMVDGARMMATRTFEVRRNPKAEIFYATGPGTSVNADINLDLNVDFDDFLLYQTAYGHDVDPAGTIYFGTIGEHRFWHELVRETTGAEFFRFHRGFIQKADCWRGIFGYPCVQVYATAPGYVPVGDEVDHMGMGSSFAGGCDANGDGNGVICRQRHVGTQFGIQELAEEFTIAGNGAGSLGDFADPHEIVLAIIGYHDLHHSLICNSGDFTFSRSTPADPIFWRFHLMLTKVHELWQYLQLDGTTMMVEATTPAGAQVFFPDEDLTVPTSCSNPVVQECDFDSGQFFPVGTTMVTCNVRDVMMLDDSFPNDPGLNQGGQTKINFDITVTNPPPTIVCPGPQLAECVSPDGTVVTLAAEVDDPNGDQLLVTWEVDNLIVQEDVAQAGDTVELTHAFSLGDHTVSVSVDDGTTVISCETTVSIVDTTPPVVTVGDLIEIWPPNHGYHIFDLSDCVISVEDGCDGPLDVDVAGTILRIYSDEPEDANGDGNTLNDIVILGPVTFLVRAERQGAGNGRVYGIVFEVSDASGNATEATCFVGVPHDQSGAPPIDDGPGSGYTVLP